MAYRTRITPSPGRRLGLQCDGLTEEQFKEILGPIMQDALFPGLYDAATAEPTRLAPTPTPDVDQLQTELDRLSAELADLAERANDPNLTD